MDVFSSSSNASYQGLVIGLAGGTILVVALAAVIWHRRRGQHAATAASQVLVSRYYWVELADGRVVRVAERGRRTKGVGLQPLLWDVGLGNRTVAEYDPVEGFDGLETTLSDECEKGQLPRIESDEPFTPAFSPQWKPASVVLPDHVLGEPVKPEQPVQVSVLVAMPFSQSHSSASSEASCFSDLKRDDEAFSPLNELDDDTEYYPPLEIGSALVNVNTVDAAAWKALTADVDARVVRHQAIASRKPPRQQRQRHAASSHLGPLAPPSV